MAISVNNVSLADFLVQKLCLV